MTVTFSNGVEINVFNVTENIDPYQQNIILIIKSNEKLDLNTVYHQVADGMDKITVTESTGDTEVFTGYNKIVAIENIINETGALESSIRLSKASSIE